ncbi:hypothetical protein UF10_03150 [Peptostreptococcus russellii]|uniref:Lipoprotein n=2 Tax=Peptostreptococcus russellii TaxID=215200 RepID=A0A2P7Q1Z2_9FIRM|nr:hypothetical protein UF10_03150 [Peptostreptococcus russellii]
MFKKLVSVVLITMLVILIPGCSNDKSVKSDNKDITNKKAEVTIYLPEGQDIDNKYKDDIDIAVNYLPDNGKDFTKKDVDTIVNNIDKHVKVLVISTEKSGLSDVFKKVKEKLPGVITVAGDIGEMHNDKFASLLKNPNLDVGFRVEKNKCGKLAAEMAEQMNANKFLYLYLEDTKENPNLYEDISQAKAYCDKNGMAFSKLAVKKEDINSGLAEKIKAIQPDKIENLAVYPASSALSKEVLNGAVKNSYIIPYLNSGQDGNLLSDKLNLDKEYKELSRLSFDKKVQDKLSKINMDGKIAGISEGVDSVPAELTIEIAKYMYERNYMIEECYTDDSVKDRANRMLDLSILPEYIGASSGYIKNLSISPRVY